MRRFRLLITKKISPSLELKAGLNGIDVLEKEFINVVPVKSSGLQSLIERLATDTQFVVFTSKNAVKSVASYGLQNVDWKIFCLEGATKQMVELYFGNDKIVGVAKSAMELGELIVHRDDIKEVVFFCGDKRLNNLPDTLKEANIHVNEMVVYETKLSPQKIVDDYDAVAFFSPTAVQSFFSENRLSDTAVCLSVGKTTTETLKSYTSNEIITAANPAEHTLIDLAITLNNQKY